VRGARSRILVEDSIYDEFVTRLGSRADRLQVGDPRDLGAITSAAQLEKVERYVDIGQREGATLVAGGRREPGRGFFYRATVFADVDNRMRIPRGDLRTGRLHRPVLRL
jgi:acyl-CoA reductase-like NAD-dependent aldehyde dehydrogenase